jgi:hypothetical protein
MTAPAFTRRRGWRIAFKIAMAALVLVPCLYGFGTKFIELIAVYRGEVDGAFAIAPIVNYLLASSGFLLLFLWATLNGMFRDLEQPKRTMLENEAWLDLLDGPYNRRPNQ